MRQALVACLFSTLAAGTACGPPPVRMPQTLPAQPVVWPFARGTNVVQLRPALLQQRAGDTALGARGLSHGILGHLTGLRAVLQRCRVTTQTRLDRVLLGLRPFDKILSGAVVVLQGDLNAPAVVQCLAALRPRFGFRPFRFGPYTGVAGALGPKSIRVFTLAQNTLVLAVGSEAKRAVAVVSGRSKGLPRRQREVHFGAGAQGAAATVTISRFTESGYSIFTSAVVWAIRIARSVSLRVFLTGDGQMQLRATLYTGGTLSALKFMMQWHVLKAVLSRLSPDASQVLASAQVQRRGGVVHLSVDAGAPGRQAFGRLSGSLLGRIGGVSAAPQVPPPGDAPPPPGAGAPPPGGTPPPPGDTPPTPPPAPNP